VIWDRGGVAVLEFDLDPGSCGVFRGDANKRSADIYARNPVRPEPGKRDREISRSRRYFEYPAVRPHDPRCAAIRAAQASNS
jgi:hypothetical protein